MNTEESQETDEEIIKQLRSGKVHGITERPSEDETELILEIKFVGKRLSSKQIKDISEFLENIIEEDKEMADRFWAELDKKSSQQIENNS